MKIAILSDAHGNDIYFNKCLKALEKNNPDKIIFLGDCFGYMREGNKILDRLREIGAHILLGNHEAMLLGQLSYDENKEEIYGLKKDRENISESNIKYVKGLISKLYQEIDSKKMLFVHGNPNNTLNGYLYENDSEYKWGTDKYDYVFMGHTHYPYIKKVGYTTYVNVGSCGLPRDRGDAPSYVIFDTHTDEVILKRVLMNISEIEIIKKRVVHPKVIECLKRGRNSL